ncbi:hypothetical protein N6H14_23060 [Paenibacillus sp. CC-CFT747]|nr:hypothetical protein N6H14_23060 [Paenibacillus sp. CC-CFT747]
MQPEAVIVRLGELTLKGKNRHRFERKLKDQLQALLVPYPKIGLKQEFGRIYIELNGEPYEKIAEGLDKIFGLVSYSPAYQSEMDLEAIRAKGLNLVKSEVRGRPPSKFP